MSVSLELQTYDRRLSSFEEQNTRAYSDRLFVQVCPNKQKFVDPHKGKDTLLESKKSNTFDVAEKDHVALKTTDALQNNREGAKVL